jgi:hypothetical protein
MNGLVRKNIEDAGICTEYDPGKEDFVTRKSILYLLHVALLKLNSL